MFGDSDFEGSSRKLLRAWEITFSKAFIKVYVYYIVYSSIIDQLDQIITIQCLQACRILQHPL